MTKVLLNGEEWDTYKVTCTRDIDARKIKTDLAITHSDCTVNIHNITILKNPYYDEKVDVYVTYTYSYSEKSTKKKKN